MASASHDECGNASLAHTDFLNVSIPYAAQPLLCLRPPSTPERQEAPMLHLSTPGIGWSLDWPSDDPCRWLTAPALDPAVFLHHYGRSYLWQVRERPLWTTEMLLECLEQLPAHSYALVELSHVLHSLPPALFPRLLTTLTRLCRPGGVVRWVEGSWLQSQGPHCRRAIAWVQQLARERGAGCPDADPETQGRVTVLPGLMQRWLRRMSGQPVERLDASLHLASPQQEAQRRALAALFPFWLRNMTDVSLLPAPSGVQAWLCQAHEHLVDEIMQPTFTATCTLHVVWTQLADGPDGGAGGDAEETKASTAEEGV